MLHENQRSRIRPTAELCRVQAHFASKTTRGCSKGIVLHLNLWVGTETISASLAAPFLLVIATGNPGTSPTNLSFPNWRTLFLGYIPRTFLITFYRELLILFKDWKQSCSCLRNVDPGRHMHNYLQTPYCLSGASHLCCRLKG
jgi:hypothetical protein